MLSNKRAFQKNTAAETMASVLNEDPPELFTTLSKNIPPAIIQITLRCLEKSPERRFQSALDLAFAIESLSGSTQHAPLRPSQSRNQPGSRRVLALLSVLAVGLLGFLIGRSRGSATTLAPPPALSWRGERLDGPSIAFTPRVSADGKELAFTTMVQGQSQLGLMLIDSGDWKILTTNKTRGSLGSITWSPDGSQIYYDRFAGYPRGVYRIAKYGGEERLVVDGAACPRVLSDGMILLAKLETREGPGRAERFYFYLYSPDTDALKPLNGSPDLGMISPVALSANRKALVFRGRATNDLASRPNLWIIDLGSGKTQRFLTNLPAPLPRNIPLICLGLVGIAKAGLLLPLSSSALAFGGFTLKKLPHDHRGPMAVMS